MAISDAARARLRLVMQDIPKADEIIDAADQILGGVLMIKRIVDVPLTVPAGYTMVQRDVEIGSNGSIDIQLGGELLVI
jgi:hypothetical protein